MSAIGWKTYGNTKERLAVCGNCEARYPESKLAELRDFFSRVEPGDTVPAGECPGCGAAAFLVPISKRRP